MKTLIHGFTYACLSLGSAIILTGNCVADLEFTLFIEGDPNEPIVSVVNTSTSGEVLTDFELTIGDVDYNFDGITNILPPIGGEVKIISPDNDVDGGVRSDSIVLEITNFDPGEFISFQTDIDRDNFNSSEDYRAVLFNHDGEQNAIATGLSPQGAQATSIVLENDVVRNSYGYSTTGEFPGEPGNGDLGFVLEILDDTNTPTLRLTNQSSGTLGITALELTIGDSAFNFDSVTGIVTPTGTDLIVTSPDSNDSGGERSDLIRMALTGFDSGKSVTFVVDIDRDDTDTTEDYREVLFNNGEAPNAVITAFTGTENCSVTLQDDADRPYYRFECGPTCPGIDVGLIAHFPLDGTALDATGHGHDGTTFGAVSVADREGNASGAYVFDGVDNYIGVPYSAELQPPLVTLALWAQRDSWTAESFSDDAALAGNTDTGGYEFFIDRSADELQAYARVRSGSYAHPAVSLTGLASGWHHFAMTCDGVNTVLYVDGQPVAFDSTGDGMIHYTQANSFIIGEEASAGSTPEGDNFSGRLDDVRVYKRVLCPEEIRMLSGKITPAPSPPLRMTYIARDPATHAITLNWEPAVDSGTIEYGSDLSGWQALAAQISGTTWSGPIPGNSAETYLRLRASSSD